MSEKQKVMQEKRRGAFYRNRGAEEHRGDSGGEADGYAERIIGKP